MPGLSGMELAREIRSFDRAADLIFLTTSPEFAVESYTVKATNYLMKPIAEKQLSAALDDICQAREKEQGSTILLKSTIGMHKIRLSGVMYVEAQGRKVIYYLQTEKKSPAQIVSPPYANSCFHTENLFWCTASFLVNMNYIRSIGTMDMCLHNGTKRSACTAQGCRYQKHYLAFQMEE